MLPPTIFGFNSVLFFSVLLWSIVWKGIALWRAGRNSQPGWFIALLIINTAGIFEIIYLAFFQKGEQDIMAEAEEAEEAFEPLKREEEKKQKQQKPSRKKRQG